MINLISDTVTKPTPAMLNYMMKAEVGDDVFRADPTVNRLEEKVATMFNKEASLFCASGTMANQIAIRCHTEALDEVLCEESSHIFQYESGAYAVHSSVAINPIHGVDGKLSPNLINKNIKPEFDWLPHSRLVVIENTANKGGGSYYTYDEVIAINDCCKKSGLTLHMDGARLFNAIAESNYSTEDIGSQVDSISICLSKGLGAPVGSMLIGDQHMIKRARRFRKAMGGGMRQAGYLAAAGIYALDHHIPLVKTDNYHAKMIGSCLKGLDFVEELRPVQTNIVIFKLVNSIMPKDFLAYLEERKILSIELGNQFIRFVTHFEISEEMILTVIEALEEYDQSRQEN